MPEHRSTPLDTVATPNMRSNFGGVLWSIQHGGQFQQKVRDLEVLLVADVLIVFCVRGRRRGKDSRG